MLEPLRVVLRRLQGLLSGKAEKAYARRDTAEPGSPAASYADGEAHAYGVASDDARKSEKKESD